jgi:soluble lytic murein transglycosylase-like protein
MQLEQLCDVSVVSDLVLDYYLTVIRSNCKLNDINFNHIVSLVSVESNFNPNAISYKGYNSGLGLMQVSKVAFSHDVMR